MLCYAMMLWVLVCSERGFAFLDTETDSKMLLTTRIKNIVPGCSEVQLEVRRLMVFFFLFI